MAGLPGPLARALAAGPAVSPAVSDADLRFDLVAPELRPAIEALGREVAARPPLSAASLATWRGSPGIARPSQGKYPVEMKSLPRPASAGGGEVTVYVINAGHPGQKRPAILHTHGGGYVMGSAARSVPGLQAVCDAFDCTIVTVEYRLAPETTYAGSIEDNYTGLKWLHDNAASLGVDPARIAVMGESAGGGHAALLAITARDRGEVPLAFQCLVYPMLDDRTGSSRAVPPSMGHLIWTPAYNRYGWEAFLGMKPGGANVPVRGVPARTRDLTGLPPAFIGVGAIDLFADEDIEYARRLADTGIPVTLNVVPGAYHAFDGIAAQTDLARRFTDSKLAALKRALLD
ncbi:alpha/beta hydrolase [Novosphingobium sp. 9]|uniref:alpha/beta hydrolase n=1 Tax=Novosphingobium sp. 9 TaxID=2025349 RepID=UPI0021B65E5E|nr:alpha/beta hydrolase [Novosphingobium sp. 9]